MKTNFIVSILLVCLNFSLASDKVEEKQTDNQKIAIFTATMAPPAVSIATGTVLVRADAGSPVAEHKSTVPKQQANTVQNLEQGKIGIAQLSGLTIDGATIDKKIVELKSALFHAQDQITRPLVNDKTKDSLKRIIAEAREEIKLLEDIRASANHNYRFANTSSAHNKLLGQLINEGVIKAQSITTWKSGHEMARLQQRATTRVRVGNELIHGGILVSVAGAAAIPFYVSHDNRPRASSNTQYVKANLPKPKGVGTP